MNHKNLNVVCSHICPLLAQINSFPYVHFWFCESPDLQQWKKPHCFPSWQWCNSRAPHTPSPPRKYLHLHAATADCPTPDLSPRRQRFGLPFTPLRASLPPSDTLCVFGGELNPLASWIILRVRALALTATAGLLSHMYRSYTHSHVQGRGRLVRTPETQFRLFLYFMWKAIQSNLSNKVFQMFSDRHFGQISLHIEEPPVCSAPSSPFSISVFASSKACLRVRLGFKVVVRSAFWLV